MHQPVIDRRALLALSIGMAVVSATSTAFAQDAKQAPLLTSDAESIVAKMGKALSVDGFAFHLHTIREYTTENQQPLHIFHDANIVVRRPDRLMVEINGDDGSSKAIYDGKILTLYSPQSKRYASVPAPNTIQSTLQMAGKRLKMDFPIADLLADSPSKAFLSGVTAGWVADTVSVAGVPCAHLFLMQPPGIELEIWVEQNNALPRRLIITYRSLPGEPRFIAEMSDWHMNIKPTDADFQFQAPPDATKVEIKEETSQ